MKIQSRTALTIYDEILLLRRRLCFHIMQGLQRQYDELAEKLQSMKTHRRHSSVKMSASSHAPSSDESSEEPRLDTLPTVERIGESIFDIEFLEKCRECLEQQLTSRRHGATPITRLKELAGPSRFVHPHLKQTQILSNA